jgi:hypothetical protein
MINNKNNNIINKNKKIIKVIKIKNRKKIKEKKIFRRKDKLITIKKIIKKINNKRKKKNICEENKKIKERIKEINNLKRIIPKDPIKSNKEKNNKIKTCVLKNFLEEKYNNKDCLELSVPQLYPKWNNQNKENIWIIGTLNCHGLNKPGEILAFSSLFRAMKADIMILTETWDNEVTAKSRKKALWMTNRIWTETSYDPNINRLRKGVTIAFSERIHKHLAFTEIPKNNNKDTGCLVKSILSFRRNKIAIIGIYIPTNYQDKEDRIFVINKTIEWIRDSREKDNHMILAGDLNEWIFEKNRVLSKLGKYIKRCSWLKEVWNQINININGSTFPLKDPNHKIDYIYISEGLINNVTQAATSRTQTDIGEDHSSL